jgi:hypothetical protein
LCIKPEENLNDIRELKDALAGGGKEGRRATNKLEGANLEILERWRRMAQEKRFMRRTANK